MLVFRDGRRTVRGAERLRSLIDRVRESSAGSHQPESLLEALLSAGEMECAVADASAPGIRTLAALTDSLAAELLGRAPERPSAESLAAVAVPASVQVSTPEGFAYYALHPLNYADLAARLENGRTAVLGIRSIGTTLSAVVTAALRHEGVPASRMTVRPTGHPFDRQLNFDNQQAAWIKAECAAGSEFWVVDEGPGLSGSSFLSVAEALERVGVARTRIRLLCGAEPRTDRLCTPDAPTRWGRYHAHAVAAPWRKPHDAAEDVSGGQWRSGMRPNSWPSSWTQFERSRFLSQDQAQLYKFEGFGRFGGAVAERAERIAAAGFGPASRPESDGYWSYPMLAGRAACELPVDRPVLYRLASYCAFRAAGFAAETDPTELENMMAWNFFEEFGEELAGDQRLLPVVRPVIADGRMQRHEWIAGERLWKTDGASHGDDHFFPGPCDIAWDLAGTIVEWELNGEAAREFVRRYEVLSGDRAQARIPAYSLAYAMFRLGYCKMAADAMQGSDEETRLRRDYERYRAIAAQMKNRAAAA